MKIGLDCSTTVAGWAFAESGEIKDAGFMDISDVVKNSDKAYKIVNMLMKHPMMSSVTEINLEAALSGFIGGGTTQQTIIKLVRFNAILEYILSKELNITVNLLNVSTMRKKVFGKARLKGVKSKDYVKMMIPKVVPNIANFEKLNKIGNVDKKCEDMYDAIVASLS